MKSKITKFLLKLLLADVIIIMLIVGIGAAFIVSDCISAHECEARGYLLGQGAIQFIIFADIVSGVIYYYRNRGK